MKKKRNLIFFLIIIVVILILGVIVIDFLSKKEVKTINYVVKESITVESGDRLPKFSDYFEGDKPDSGNITYYHKGIDVTDKKDYYFYTENGKGYVMDTFNLEVKIVADNGITYSSNLIIEDTKEPEVEFGDFTVQSYTSYEAKEFVKKYSDNSHLDEYVATFPEETYEEIGNYEIAVKVCDLSENCVTGKANLEIIPGETKVGTYKLSYGKYVGEICDETGITYCKESNIYVLGKKIKLNDGTLKTYLVDGNNMLLSNGEVFTIIDNNKLQYNNTLKSIYEFKEAA